MKVNLDKEFRDCFGSPITEKRGGRDVPLRVGERLARSLFNLSALDGKPLGQEEKYTAYSLSRRIARHPAEVELTTEEASFVKRVSAEQLSAGAYGFVADLIEGKTDVEP